MNLSIYIKLWIASTFGKVKINPNYKHLEFLKDSRYIIPKLDVKASPSPEPGPYLKDWYDITSRGKESMWGKAELIHTKWLSWIAIGISLLSLAFSIYTHLTK
ncbi:hypothetical protein [Bacillus sp. mrc49]|uniref:hypothetical protein n=1 Tax=Bacillus sp. mrc49 TaxID=2054913 RepID=UPI000C276D44|nr:hypothetical protein [Bacillus sp. mrc49]PJN91562.1 hypothetical protein CVN76_04345 [Bacillus sp. mrc49]